MSQNVSNTNKVDRLLAEQRDYIAKRESGYRERALKMYPWVCGRCAREFTRINLRELTVHHVDHDHDNNPADGSNWELLCVYCHDEEHSKFEDFVRYGGSSEKRREVATHNPFAGLKDALQKKNE
ncbi:YajD family HNH nuclease [Marinobacter salexigens]|uniref:YajD family HNH nuclease n=1 Tax=Marinobacter salexigens TaxID=1925763 RepID=UPI000C290937|nr:YajD family HNH nuclease [Marinobacter salexigens]